MKVHLNLILDKNVSQTFFNLGTNVMRYGKLMQQPKPGNKKWENRTIAELAAIEAGYRRLINSDNPTLDDHIKKILTKGCLSAKAVREGIETHDTIGLLSHMNDLADSTGEVAKWIQQG